jgi:hypothetical protein
MNVAPFVFLHLRSPRCCDSDISLLLREPTQGNEWQFLLFFPLFCSLHCHRQVYSRLDDLTYYVPYDTEVGFGDPREFGVGVQVKFVGVGEEGAELFALHDWIQWGSIPPRSLRRRRFYHDSVTKVIETTASGTGKKDKVKLQLWNCGYLDDDAPFPWRNYHTMAVALFCFRYSPELLLEDVESVALHLNNVTNRLKPWIEAVGIQLAGIPLLPVVVGFDVNCLPKEEKNGPQFCSYHTQLLRRVREVVTQYLPDTTIPIASLQAFHISTTTGEGIDSLLQYIANNMMLTVDCFPSGMLDASGDSVVRRRPGAIKLPALSQKPQGSFRNLCFA